MDDAAVVAVGKALEELVHHGFEPAAAEGALLDHLAQVALAALKDKQHLVRVHHHVQHAHHVRVLQVAQNRDLTQLCARDPLKVGPVADPLYCNRHLQHRVNTLCCFYMVVMCILSRVFFFSSPNESYHGCYSY